MANFAQVFPEAGVEPDGKFMVVGKGHFNIVAFQGGNGFSFPAAQSKGLTVTEIKDAKGFSTLTDTMNSQFSGWNLKGAKQTKNYLDKIHGKLHSSDLRVLLVKGNAGGKTKIDAVSGRLATTIEVAVVPAKTFKIAFRFVQLTDDGNREKKTQWGASDAQDLLNMLNWTYGPQTNISFTLDDAKPVPLAVKRDADKIHLEDKLFGPTFKRLCLSEKNQTADLTVFFVKNYIAADKSGISETFTDEKACVVEDDAAKDIKVIDGEDPFVVNFAHEVGHFLQDTQNPKQAKTADFGHHDRDSILMSRKVQSTRIDKALMNMMTKA